VADSKRLVVLKALTSHLLADLTVANGYQHDLAGCYRGRTFFSENTALPCVALVEALNPDTDSRPPSGNYAVKVNTWHVLVQGWVVDDEENPTDPAYLLAADVQKSLAKLVPGRIDRLVEEISFEAPVCRPPDDVSSRAYFWLRLTLKIKDNSADPYRLD
jgi:hypothetical protein